MSSTAGGSVRRWEPHFGAQAAACDRSAGRFAR